MRLEQVSAPSGAGQCSQRSRSVHPAEQVSVPSGAGQCTQRRRSDFALLTCAWNRHPGPFSGAGPHHQNGPAPFTSLTCTVHRSLLRHPLHPPAPLTLLTCTTHPPTCAIHRFLLLHWLHRPGPQQGPPPRWHNALALIPPTAPPHATMCGGYQHTEPPPRNTQLGG